ncbi:MAG TPA: hypothetical protein VFY40_15980 [Blastocatellia bacterium]|nr:hypothetical protein [Blastocatellia bacterium]
MNNLNHYQREMKAIAHDAGKDKGRGHWLACLMMIVGVVVTGTMTYALTVKGMSSSRLWRTWVDVAAFLPVVLLEGSALALVYGRHHWFRSEEQRRIANTASGVIWVLLATTSVVHFAFGSTNSTVIRWLMGIYASYILPLAIVGVPMLWKKLYDAAPDSMMRVAVLEAEASLRSQMVDVEKEQNALMIAAYREALDTPRVTQARRQLFEQASIEHDRNIAGFIEGAQDETPQRRPGFVNQDRRRGGVLD